MYSKEERLATILFMMDFLFMERTGTNTGMLTNVEENNDYKNTLISSIKKTSNLDFYHLPKTQILEYEDILDKLASDIINETPNNSIQEEIELIKKSVDADITLFEDINKIIHIPFIKGILKTLSLSENQIANWLKKPDFSQLYKYENNEIFYCTKKIRLKNKETILFYILSNRLISVEDEIMKNIRLEDIFVVSYKRFNDMLSSPIRLFLNMIDEYGVEIELNGERKKIFLDTISDKSEKDILNEFISNSKILRAAVSGGTQNIEGNKYLHKIVWALNYGEYITDYKRGNI